MDCRHHLKSEVRSLPRGSIRISLRHHFYGISHCWEVYWFSPILYFLSSKSEEIVQKTGESGARDLVKILGLELLLRAFPRLRYLTINNTNFTYTDLELPLKSSGAFLEECQLKKFCSISE